MGQTLTHGVYLPDEGERNCYNGLAANWSILDGAVGTVAEHTTQIAGKAPAVHTHTKADITDFPAYGTTAGTICEGNDSRLSDARTPVAHTHTKADVTDLLNSNFIPSANNSYDLGSSSYQWNNLYAKNYYYNGTAWGVDQANVWSAWQTIEKTNSESLLRLRRTDIKIGDSIPANQINVGSLGFAGSDDFNLGLITCRDETNGNTRLVLATRQKYDSNGDRSNNGTVYESRVDIGITSSRALYLRPYVDNLVNLGTSTNKWKTLNGINPGALSLPNKPGGSGTVNVNYFDLSGNVTVKDGSTYNSYTALCDGWIVIGSFASEISIEDDTTNLATTAVPKSNGYAQAYLPVRQGDTVRITINQTNTQYQNFKLIPCQGNV